MKKDFPISFEIYSKETLIIAIEDFSEIAEISFWEQIISVSWETEAEVQETFHEFMNYVLSL